MKPLQQAKNRIASNRPKRMLGRRSSDGGSNGQAWRRSLAQLGAPQPGQQRHRRRQQQGAGPVTSAAMGREPAAAAGRGSARRAAGCPARRRGRHARRGSPVPSGGCSERMPSADRQVDQEHAAPAEAADVGGDQEAAEHLADDEGQAADGAVGGQRAGMRVAAEADMQVARICGTTSAAPTPCRARASPTAARPNRPARKATRRRRTGRRRERNRRRRP